jgi:hypothetical protein
VLDAAEALFLGSRNQHAIANKTSRGIAVAGVEAEDVSHLSD